MPTREEIELQKLASTISIKPPPNRSIPTSLGVCPQCKLIHPPLKPGERCPNAKVDIPGISEADVGMFMASMKNIIISNIEKNAIKNGKKLFQNLTMTVAQFMESYKEE
jgi:hypothetical protein